MSKQKTDSQNKCYACFGRIVKHKEYAEVWICTKCRLFTDIGGFEINPEKNLAQKDIDEWLRNSEFSS